MSTEERAERILEAVEFAKSRTVLKFLGEVIKVHKQTGQDWTNDERNLERIRVAYKARMQELSGVSNDEV